MDRKKREQEKDQEEEELAYQLTYDIYQTGWRGVGGDSFGEGSRLSITLI